MLKITFAVPQVRDGGFYPQALEKGQRSERALTLTLAADGSNHHWLTIYSARRLISLKQATSVFLPSILPVVPDRLVMFISIHLLLVASIRLARQTGLPFAGI